MTSHTEYSKYLQNRRKISKFYRKFWLYPKISKFINGSLLDIGCGIGDMLEFYPNSTGLDINLNNIEFCKKKGLHAFHMQYDKIPFLSKSFDTVLLDNVLEHIADPNPLLDEINRVLRVNGSLIIGVPGIKGFMSDSDHKVYYDEKKLINLSLDNNFLITKFFYAPFFQSNILSKYLKQYCVYSKLILNTSIN